MKNPCFLLVKNRLISQTGLNVIRYGRDKHKKASRISVLIAICMVFTMLSVYSGAYAYGLTVLGIGSLIPVYSFFICSLITLLFSSFSANGELFAYRDFDFLMSLPIRTSTVIASRFLTIYIWNTIFSVLIMLPMGIVYAVLEKPGMWFYPMWAVGILVTCFIPTTIAVIFGALITAIASRFKHSGVVTSVIILVITMTALILPFSMISGPAVTTNGNLNPAYFQKLLPAVSQEIFRIYPPARLYAAGVLEGKVGHFLALVVISLGWYLLFIRVLAIWYKKINTGVSTYHVSSNYKMQSLKQNSTLYALYQKEINRWLRSSVYLTNTVVGGIIAVIFSASILIFGTDAAAKSLEMPQFSVYAEQMGPFLIAACVGMCCTTGSSISLEGKSLWIIQTIPVTIKEVIDSKILVNLTICIPSACISAILYILAVKPGVAGSLIFVLVPVAVSVFISVWGIWLNLKMPNYEWESDTQVVKQSICSVLSLLPGMLIGAFFAAVVYITGIDYRIVGFAAILLLLILAAGLYISLMNRKKI